MPMLLAAIALGSFAVPQSEAEVLKKRGFEVLEQIRREYFIPNSRLYSEEIDGTGKKSGPAFNWGVGVMLSALNAASRLNPKYKPWLREYADASRVYWNDKGPVPGYDVLPCPKPVDRYYDDNAWMILALMETYEILGDKKYLDWAEQALDYVLSGYDEKLGGGIYWKETEKKGKNACSNAPSAAAALAVARYRRKEELVGRAEGLMRWVNRTLVDPKDGLVWDNQNLNGRIDKTKYSYNTGLYLRGWKMLEPYVQLDNPGLKRTYDSSLKYWIVSETGAAKDGGRFVHLWFEGLLEMDNRNVETRKAIAKALDYANKNARNTDGRYADRWDRPIDKNRKKFSLIDQASAARAFLFLAGQKP
jgi:hypothetical protein